MDKLKYFHTSSENSCKMFMYVFCISTNVNEGEKEEVCYISSFQNHHCKEVFDNTICGSLALKDYRI